MDRAAAIAVGSRIRVIGDELNTAIQRGALAPAAVYDPELLQDVPSLVAVACLSFVMGWCLCRVVTGRS